MFFVPASSPAPTEGKDSLNIQYSVYRRAPRPRGQKLRVRGGIIAAIWKSACVPCPPQWEGTPSVERQSFSSRLGFGQPTRARAVVVRRLERDATRSLFLSLSFSLSLSLSFSLSLSSPSQIYSCTDPLGFRPTSVQAHPHSHWLVLGINHTWPLICRLMCTRIQSHSDSLTFRFARLASLSPRGSS